MARPVALFITTFVVSSFVVYWATASAFGQILPPKQSAARPQYARGSNCQIEVAGQMVQLQLGQGIRTADGWRNCQTYEGHSFIVYSTKPPQSIVVDSGN
ncbi:MAG: hypothetical protein HY847_00735 [Betaproteobacteria bacterium]|nr:hypothetical protein [Betaproteobacteria bacterium]